MWLTGDFHAHSILSDGLLDPRRLIEEAEREELDFFAITDHNVWAFPHFPDSAQVLVMAGVELTMPYGHFNVFAFSPDEPEWMTTLPPPMFVERGEEQHGASKGLVDKVAAGPFRASINHPLLFPWEWTDPSAPLDRFDYLEVWNDPTWPENRTANPAALDMWTRWLQAGHRITAVGGSDFHNPDKTLRGDGVTVDGHRVGAPRTCVWADSCETGAILTAVDLGRVYVTMGPHLELELSASGGDPVFVGDDLGAFEGRLAVDAQATGIPGLTVELVVNGSTVAASDGGRPRLSHRLHLDAGWLRVDVRDQQGEVVAFTNPIFFGDIPVQANSQYGTFHMANE